jgi:hypothetical protein
MALIRLRDEWGVSVSGQRFRFEEKGQDDVRLASNTNTCTWTPAVITVRGRQRR